jgi:hypothetical protein
MAVERFDWFGAARLHRSGDRVLRDDLRWLRSMYASYYNGVRTHLALGKDTPIARPIERFVRITDEPIPGDHRSLHCRIAVVYRKLNGVRVKRGTKRTRAPRCIVFPSRTIHRNCEDVRNGIGLCWVLEPRGATAPAL